ncbi:MAG: lipoprotein [Granulosicoccaceae bacterium]|jgi:predicted small lipoprotein YifL
MLRVIIFSLCTLLMAACGQKGDLYLPHEAASSPAQSVDTVHHAG